MLNDRARHILDHAREEARDLRHDYLGSEHILLGMALEGKGLAVMILIRLGIDVEQLRQRDPASFSQDD